MKSLLCLSLTALFISGTAVQAVTIVDLPATGFTSSGNFVGTPSSGAGTVYTTLGGLTGSEANLISPSSTATATSEVFYGAIEGSFNVNGAWRPTINLTTANTIEIRSRAADTGGACFPGGTTPEPGGFAGFVLWKDDNFLGDAASSYNFDSASRITLNVANIGTAAQNNVCYLINIGSNYYVSSNLLSNSAGAKNSGDLTSLTWLNYNPNVLRYSFAVAGEYSEVALPCHAFKSPGFTSET